MNQEPSNLANVSDHSVFFFALNILLVLSFVVTLLFTFLFFQPNPPAPYLILLSFVIFGILDIIFFFIGKEKITQNNKEKRKYVWCALILGIYNIMFPFLLVVVFLQNISPGVIFSG